MGFGCSQIYFYELKFLLKMKQVYQLWKMKLCRFLHVLGMFPLKILRGLCRILHTPGMILFIQQIFGSSRSWEVLAKIQVLWIFVSLISFCPDPKIRMVWLSSIGLAIIHWSGRHLSSNGVFHVEVLCAIGIFCA